MKKDEPKKYQPQMTKETKQTALEQFAIALYEKGLLIGYLSVKLIFKT